MSGTSMATPATAGVVALLLQAKPDLKPEDVKAILMNTADPLSKPYSVFEVGAGRVDPYNAIHSTIELKVAEKTPTIINNKEKQIRIDTAALSFGNKAYTGNDISDTRSVTLLNRGEKSKTFNVSVNFQSNLRGSKDAVKNGVTVDTTSSITLKGISQKKTSVTLTIPKTAEKGIYEGYVVYTNKDNPAETYKIPFGVHYVEQGLADFNLSKNSVSSLDTQYFQYFWGNKVAGTFSLKSHMRYLDIVLTDAKTGMDIGLLNSYDGVGINEGILYNIAPYNGGYYPFTNDPKNPVDYNAVKTKEGHYFVKLIGYDDTGKSYILKRDLFVDNTMPSFDMHVEGEKPGNPFVEFKADQQNVPLTATIKDKVVDEMKSAGLSANQSQNQIWYFYNDPFSPTGQLTVDGNGNATDQIAMIPSQSALHVYFEGIDQATNSAAQKSYYFVKDNTPYVAGTPNLPTRLNALWLKNGDTVTITLTANNIDKVKEAVYNFDTTKTDTKILNIALNPEAQKLGVKDFNVTSTDKSSTVVNSNVKVSFDGTTGVSGDVPMVDITLQIPKGQERLGSSSFYSSAIKSTFTNVDNVVTRPITKTVPINILSYNSTVNGYLFAEGLNKVTSTGTGVDTAKDYTTIGSTVQILDKNGNAYNGTIAKNGSFKILNLPTTKDEYTLKIDIPGHFTQYGDFDSYLPLDDQIGGKYWTNISNEVTGNAVAGDINKDNVIDVMDAIAIQTYWGTNKRSADINFDGNVDAKDLAFVEKNYLLQNKQVDNAPSPKKQYKGETLQSIKNSLGIN
ncbi:S8 family serine peptidase [Arthrobacter citreus]|nr:S8 family serine peptidase [Arthrobacter citreus]